MKKSKALWYTAFAVAFWGLTSCGSDSPRSVGTEEAKVAFNSVNQTLSQDLGSMTEADGFTAMNRLAELTNSSNPFGRKSSFKKKEVRDQIKVTLSSVRISLINSAGNRKISEDEPFDFNEKKGVYAWNSTTEEFDRTGDSDIVKILFPTEGSATNDAEFRLTAYQEESTPNGETLYSPTFIEASLLVDGTEVAELSLDVEYGDNDSPVFAEVIYSVTPYSLEVNFDDRGAKSTSFSETLSKNGQTLIGVGVKASYYSASKSDADIKSASGHLQLANIRFNVSIDTEDAEGAEDFTDLIKISVKVDGGNAGKIVFEYDDETGEPIPFVKFNDGTTQSLESLFEDLALQLEDLIS